MLKSWVNYATPKARNIVRQVLSSNQNQYGMSTQEIYKAVLEQFPNESAPAPPVRGILPGQRGKYGNPPKAMPEPPNREHPIRSLRYLKLIVLEDLASRNEVHKIHIRRGAGGTDENGNKLDMVSIPGHGKKPALTHLAGTSTKEAWIWKLNTESPAAVEKPIVEKSAEGSEGDEREAEKQLKLEEDNVDDAHIALFPEGWENKLKFNDVSPYDLPQPPRGRTRRR